LTGSTEVSEPAEVEVFVPLEPRTARFDPVHRELLVLDAAPFSREALDAALSIATEGKDDTAGDAFLSDETPDEDISLAWDDLASAKQNWRALALA
jgi:hypothetical protein